jgi:TPR repeat protein
MKKIITICLLIAISFTTNAQAQSHIVNANYGCRLKPASLNTEKDLCPACAANDKKEQDAKIADEKQRFADAQTAATAKKEAREKERLEKIEEDKKNAESGKVYINGNTNTNTTNTSTEQIPDSYTGNPLLYNKSSTTSEYQKNVETVQQITEIATGLTELFTPTPAQLQRRAAKAVEYERQKKIKKEIEEKEKEERFLRLYYPLMKKAENGNDNAIMTLYYASYNLWCTEFVPKRHTWQSDAYNRKNTDAILAEIDKEIYSMEEKKPYIKYAASLGSVDAMIKLAIQYDFIIENNPNYSNAKLALEWFTKAAESGSPNAMYYLGMIYKYGIIEDLSKGGIVGIRKRTHVKYDVLQDEKIAFEWFSKSIQPNYEPSIYVKGTRSFHRDGSYFDEESYNELAKIYRKGKVVPKDKAKAKELKLLYESYDNDNNDRHKF